MTKMDPLGYTRETKHGDLGVEGKELKGDSEMFGLRNWADSGIIY